MSRLNSRPFVVCHMLSSLDGKIDGDFFGTPEAFPAVSAYASLRTHYAPDATVYGRTTMLGFSDGALTRKLPDASLPKEDYVSPAAQTAESFIVSLDPEGTLAFSSPIISRKGRAPAHVIEILTGKTCSDYLSYLREKGVSYLFAGEETIDCALLLEKLSVLFPIKTLMIAGGGITDWAFLQQGLIDELSLVLTPVADGGKSASIFDSSLFSGGSPISFRLLEVKKLDGDALWLRYQPV